MAQIYNPQEIINKAKEMRTQSEQLKKLINQMSGIVSEMRTVWQKKLNSFMIEEKR